MQMHKHSIYTDSHTDMYTTIGEYGVAKKRAPNKQVYQKTNLYNRSFKTSIPNKEGYPKTNPYRHKQGFQNIFLYTYTCAYDYTFKYAYT